MRKLSEDGAVSRSFTLPPDDLRDLQRAANAEFDGNVSLAVRHALKRAYGIGTVDRVRVLAPMKEKAR